MLYPPMVDELVEAFNASRGYNDTPKAMALELLQAQTRIQWLESKLRDEERDVSAGYVRRAPSHRARQPKEQIADPVTDDWISTGRNGDAQ